MRGRRFLVSLMGLSPFFAGWIKEYIRQYFYYSRFRFWDLALFLLLWYFLGFMSEDILDSPKEYEAVTFLNLPALFDLILFTAFLLSGGDRTHALFIWSRRFLFPAADYFIDTWQPPLCPAFAADTVLPYMIGFLSMVFVSFLGSHMRRYGQQRF